MIDSNPRHAYKIAFEGSRRAAEEEITAVEGRLRLQEVCLSFVCVDDYFPLFIEYCNVYCYNSY